MKALLLRALGVLALILADSFPLVGATIEVLLATGQTPVSRGISRVGSVAGGVWDRGGRVWMEGRYVPDAPSELERNALWRWTTAGSTVEISADGDAVPYYVGGVAGPVIPMSVPRLQPRFGKYLPPANYAVVSSGVASVPAAGGMLRALWTQRLDLPADLAAAFFLVNDLESHRDGTRQFIRPQIDDAVIRLLASSSGFDTNYTFITEGGGAVQYYFNSVISEAGGQGSGSMVWQARTDRGAVVGGLSNVVRAVAASADLRLPSLPGGLYSSLRILGVDAAENLLWEAGTNGGTLVLRGEPGAWTPLLGPGMAAPASRMVAPSGATPLGTVGPVGLVAHGAGFMAEATYGAAAGALAGRAALLLHAGGTAKLFALEGDTVEGAPDRTVLRRFTPGGYDWPDTNAVAFYGPVRGETLSIDVQALLLASETRVRQLARQQDSLPVPAGVDRIVRFLFPVLSAKPDGTVAFAAEIEFLAGGRREVLYTVTPGAPDRYQVLLSAGDTLTISTRDGPRPATIRGFTGAAWRPGTFDKLLVSVELETTGASAVLLVDPATAVRMDASLVSGRLRMRWPVGVGSVESTVSLALPVWSPVVLPITERDGFRELEFDPGGVARFFRVR